MQNLIEIRDLKVRYRRDNSFEFEAVSGVNFEIARGETLGLMGKSGCGKTSIALALLGLLPKDAAAGSVDFRGQNLLAMDERSLRKIRGAQISLVSQEPGIALSPVLRVGDQIAEVVRAHRAWNWNRCRAEAKSMLARVGLRDIDRIYSTYPSQLSGGQCQRIVLAQALVCEPALVIADEPTASLDACSQAEFLTLLRQIKEELQVSLLLISHNPETQASLADRLMVMAKGRIVEEGCFARLYEHPSHPYTRSMLRRNSAAEVEEHAGPEMLPEEILAP